MAKDNRTHGYGSNMKIHAAGGKPPCVDEHPGQCRGCFGWEAMVKAAEQGGVWSVGSIRCDCTGLTVKITHKQANSSPQDTQDEGDR